jgi:repressor LexA
LAELTERGLTTVPGPRTPSRTLTVSHLHRLLRHPYYVGIVRYQGGLYEGKHEPLVDNDTWHRVQELMTAKYLTGERHRDHPHYLKGSIYCGQCGSRLIVCHAKGRGSTYPYFICLGRQQKRTDCQLRALRIEKVEDAIARHYATVQLSEQELIDVRAFLEEDLSGLRLDGVRERRVQERRLVGLFAERKKLLDAHYAAAVPLDLLRSEQERLTREIDSAEGRLAEVEGDFKKAESNLKRALTRVGDCKTAYREASGPLRRQFNLAFFKRLLIDDDYNVSGELAEPFDTLLGPELRRAVAVRGSQELQDGITEVRRRPDTPNEQHPQGADLAPVGAVSTASFFGGGSSTELLVRPSGLEPPRAVKLTRPSTLRVYQFRHGRRGASIAPGSRRPPPPDRGQRLRPSTPGATVRTHVRCRAQTTPTGRHIEMDLTKRQQEIFDFIRKYSAKYGYPPTVRDIGKAVGLASSSTVHAHLANLEKIGLLRRDPSKPRAIELLDRAVGNAVDSVRGIVRSEGLPLLGSVAAGQPMLAEENIEEYVSVPEIAGGSDGEYLLRIRGESMKGAGILEGDYVVVHPQDTARDGEIVVALLGEEATVKRFFREADHVRLQPENDAMEPIRSKEVKVLGRVVGLLRSV